MLYEAGHARQEHRRIVDQVAATLILQSFLDEKTGSKRAGTAGRVKESDHGGVSPLWASVLAEPVPALAPRIMKGLVLLFLAV